MYAQLGHDLGVYTTFWKLCILPGLDYTPGLFLVVI